MKKMLSFLLTAALLMALFPAQIYAVGTPPDLNLSANDGVDLGDLESDGYHWDHTAKVLQLKNFHGGTLSIDNQCRILNEGNSTFTGIIQDEESTSASTLRIGGTGTLTLTEFGFSLNAGNTATIEQGMTVQSLWDNYIYVGSDIGSKFVIEGTLICGNADTYALFSKEVRIAPTGTLKITNGAGVKVVDKFILEPGGQMLTTNVEIPVYAFRENEKFTNAADIIQIPAGMMPAGYKFVLLSDENGSMQYAAAMVPDDDSRAILASEAVSLVKYLSGQGGAVCSGNRDTEVLSFTVNLEPDYILVDGTELDLSAYELQDTGKKIILNSTYLSSLQTGDQAHTLTCQYKDTEAPGSVQLNTSFYVYAHHSTETNVATHTQKAVCDLCGQEYGSTVPHSFPETWLSDANQHWHQCECGEKDAVANHTYFWKMDKAATAAENGSVHRECSVCGYKETEKEVQMHENPASCSQEGTKTYYEIVGESLYFADSSCQTEIADLNLWKQQPENKIPVIPHVADGGWKYNQLSHWHECARCHNLFDTANHTPDGSGWHYDATGHWHVCDVCRGKLDETSHSYRWKLDQAATETAKGSIHQECACGYARAAKEIQAHTDPATCTREGTETYYEIAGEALYFEDGSCTVPIPNLTDWKAAHKLQKTDHSPDGSGWHYDATGHWHVCDVCGGKLDVHSHNFTWEVVPQKTRAAEIKVHKICMCGYAMSERTLIIHTDPATCIHEGTETYYEVEGEAVYFADAACTEPIDDLEIWKAAHKLQKTDHTPDGHGLYHDGECHWQICGVCGQKLDEESHHLHWVEDRPATEDAAGSKHQHCSLCDWDGPAVATHKGRKVSDPASCDHEGTEDYYEYAGTDQYFEDPDCLEPIDDLEVWKAAHKLPVLPHSEDDSGWHHDETGHWQVCERCGKEMNRQPHTLNWVVDRPAAPGVTGSRHQHCDTCGYNGPQEVIPALDKPETPATGDSFAPILCLGVMLAAAAGVLLTAHRKKTGR